MPNAFANGIQIEYETFGEPSSPALILIAGIGGQMIGWDEELCKKWAEKGFYVIRFDNRDVGLSTKIEEAGVPDLNTAMTALRNGAKVNAPYSLADMADDAAGLLDALKIDKAHICGISMGGAITQTIAFKHPSRVRSMTQVYATTGNPELPLPQPEIMKLLLTTPPAEREAYIDYQMKLYKTIAGPGFPFDEDWHRNLAGRSYDRAFYGPGKARQFLATLTQGNRKPFLASITAPALVIHGADDPLVPVAGGIDSAESIPGAVLMIIEGMGHDMPHGSAWPRIVEAVAAHIRKADGL
ncbi:MAG: alpha/beta hydrolase [Chloroflexi bacterium HGW-Chloroflexi-5]|jgi:pimeloyl-ACP methyl ester carboxylesterase|nr:MAG: alpha/beta hydrolase [Deltaproteobacteria bacterium HGW-Deltaproteobacteria-12]PKN95975.1 MAG: alpha/beta hydrolase [Chloroflexi bacterium HGW-Chloroflexi-5]